jgi:hypothetical protein
MNSTESKINTTASSNFMQVLPGGLCFAHGPFTEVQCPHWPRCGDDPQNPEYVAEGVRRVNEPKERARLEREVIEAAKARRLLDRLFHNEMEVEEYDAAMTRYDELEAKYDKAVDDLLGFESKQK